MEILAVAAVVVILLLILGVSLFSLAQALLALLALALFFITIFFTVSVIILSKSNKVKSEFKGFEKKKGYDAAVYMVEDESFENIFPAENIMRKSIYRHGTQNIRIYRSRKRKFAIDRHTCVIIIIGFALSLPSFAAVIYELINIGNI